MLEPENDDFVDPTKKKSRIFGYTRFIVSSSADGTIRVWNIITGIDECYTVCFPLSCFHIPYVHNRTYVHTRGHMHRHAQSYHLHITQISIHPHVCIREYLTKCCIYIVCKNNTHFELILFSFGNLQRCDHPITCLAKTADNNLFAAGDEEGGLHVFRLWNLEQSSLFERLDSQ